jgi:hypothetical protein
MTTFMESIVSTRRMEPACHTTTPRFLASFFGKNLGIAGEICQEGVGPGFDAPPGDVDGHF